MISTSNYHNYPFNFNNKKVHLYDEIRQIMFLLPLIFIVGLVSLFNFSRVLFYVIGFISIIFFVIENIKINPYQYVWFNVPSRYFDLTNKFELEYQGISGKEIAKQILKEKIKTSVFWQTQFMGSDHFT